MGFILDVIGLTFIIYVIYGACKLIAFTVDTETSWIKLPQYEIEELEVATKPTVKKAAAKVEKKKAFVDTHEYKEQDQLLDVYQEFG